MSEAKPTIKGIPRVIGGNCEHCGTKAAACAHAAEFRKHGLLKDVATQAFMDKMRSAVAEGLPRILGDNCEFCGVYFLDEKCIHLAARRKAAFGDAEAKDETHVITEDTDTLIAQKKAAKDARRVLAEAGSKPVNRAGLDPLLGGDGKKDEAPAPAPDTVKSGDPEMDAMMDADEPLEIPASE